MLRKTKTEINFNIIKSKKFLDNFSHNNFWDELWDFHIEKNSFSLYGPYHKSSPLRKFFKMMIVIFSIEMKTKVSKVKKKLS